MSGEQGLAGGLGHTVRKREFQVLGKQLFDVRALDIIGLLEFDNLEDLLSQRMSVGRIDALGKMAAIRGLT